MPSNYTANYKLNQWAADDKVERVDFNADNAKIDAAIKAVDQGRLSVEAGLQKQITTLSGTIHKVATGSYVGNGEETQLISLAFTPIAVYVCSLEGETFWRLSTELHVCGGLALTGKPVSLYGMEALSIQTKGFRVNYRSSRPGYSYNVSTNLNGQEYHYIAIA